MKKTASMLAVSCVLMICIFSGCGGSGTSDGSSSEKEALVQDAAAWFEEQTQRYEIIAGEAAEDNVILLTGTKNYGTDSYQLLQAFVVDPAEDGFSVSAWKDGERGTDAGFSVHVLAHDSLTVIFGDTQSSIFDFTNGRRLDTAFTEAVVQFLDGTSETRTIPPASPYLIVLENSQAVEDVLFTDGSVAAKYSDFFSDDLMEDSSTYRTENLFSEG